MESPNKCQDSDGFTLVELSIVMIIIGLLIGGIFGGMKLVDNANVQKTIQDLKSFDAAGLTFKDIYRALPGDMRNASTRLPNCANAPCNINGNGDRMVGTWASNSISITDEKFVFWHHLLAAELINSVKPVSDLTPGEGQPEIPVGGVYRMQGNYNGLFWGTVNVSSKHILWLSDRYSDDFYASSTQSQDSILCSTSSRIDTKMDDGRPGSGKVIVFGSCSSTYPTLTPTSNYITTGGAVGAFWYIMAI